MSLRKEILNRLSRGMRSQVGAASVFRSGVFFRK